LQQKYLQCINLIIAHWTGAVETLNRAAVGRRPGSGKYPVPCPQATKKELATSGKSSAYAHRRKNQPAAQRQPRAFLINQPFDRPAFSIRRLRAQLRDETGALKKYLTRRANHLPMSIVARILHRNNRARPGETGCGFFHLEFSNRTAVRIRGAR
jgi:hypothetical protein